MTDPRPKEITRRFVAETHDEAREAARRSGRAMLKEGYRQVQVFREEREHHWPWPWGQCVKGQWEVPMLGQ